MNNTVMKTISIIKFRAE